MDSRAVTPVVGKLLAAGLAVLYIASLTGLLLGGVVPEYRVAAGEELGERVLATAAGHVEAAVPDSGATVDVRVRADLPASIRGEQYRLLVRDRTLVLDHPVDALDARAPLALPTGVTPEGHWTSGDPLLVSVAGPAGNRTLRLAEGSA
jgi:hypothetical protein